ncbi:oligosaccharide flippase family protein, partial [bacterium]|nr:oligosaccharide flippase family protein [bacterium]
MTGARASGGQRRVLANIGLMGAAQAATMLLNVVALVHIARTVGDTWFGVLQWGVAFSSYALIVAEWGMATLGVREVSRLDDAAAVHRYARAHLGLMMTLGALVIGLGLLIVPHVPLHAIGPVILVVYLLTIVPGAISLDWVGIGLERLGTVSAVKTLRSLLYALAVLLLLGPLGGVLGVTSAQWVPVMFLVAWLLAAAAMAWRVRGWLGGWVWPTVRAGAEWRRRLGATAPIGAGALTMRVLLNIDVMMLGILSLPAIVGQYAAAAKVVMVLVIAVEVVWKALLPRLSRAWQESPSRCRRRFSLYLGLVVLALVPLATGGVVLGPDLMDLLYGDRFAAAGRVCQVLAVSYVLLAVGQFFGNGLIATDRQRRYFPPLVAGAVVAVTLAAVLAPRQDAALVAWGMLAAHAVLLVVTGWVARDLLVRAVVRPVAVAIGAAAVMALIAGSLPDDW